MTGDISHFYLLSISNLSVIPASSATKHFYLCGRKAYLSCNMLAQGNQSIFLLFGYCCSVIKLCGSYAELSNVPMYGTFCCDFDSPFADNQTPPPRLTRRLEKNLYSSLAFDTYFPWKEKRQAQNFSWLSQNVSTTGPESPRHISWHALLRTSFPLSSALLIEELQGQFWWQCCIFIILFNEDEQCGRERRGNGCMLYHFWWCTLKVWLSAYRRRELHAEIYTWKIMFYH